MIQENRERIFNNFYSEFSGATNNEERKDIVIDKLFLPLKQSQQIISNYSFILKKNNLELNNVNNDDFGQNRYAKFRYDKNKSFIYPNFGLGNKISFGGDTMFNDIVYAITIDSNNKILVGGEFTIYNGQIRNHIIRLNPDGSIDNTFDIGSGFNDIVRTIEIDSNNKILVGGNFTTYNDQTRNNIIRLNEDGSIDNTFDIGTGFNNFVTTIKELPNNKLIIGGRFTSYKSSSYKSIILLENNGDIDTSFNIGDGFNGDVATIAIHNNILYVGGFFTEYNFNGYNRIVALNMNGTVNNGFNIGSAFDGGVRTILYDNNKLYVGGEFYDYKNSFADFIIRLNLDGSKDNTFVTNSSFNNFVFTIHIDNNKVYIGGQFTSYNNEPSNRIIRLNPDGSIDNTFNIGSGFENNIVWALNTNNNNVYVGGSFNIFNSKINRNFSFLNDTGNQIIDFFNFEGFNSTVNRIAVDNNNKIYVGGWFTTYQTQSINRIIRFNIDGSIDNTFDIGTGFNSGVETITIDNNNKIYVGGFFTSYQGQTRNNIIRLNNDGSIDNTFDIGDGFDDAVRWIAIDNNNKIVVGGNFTTYQGQTRNRIIRLNQDGSIDNTFDIGTGFNTNVMSITIDSNNKIYVGGNFTSYQNQTRNYIIRLNQDGSIDNTFDIGTGFDGTVLTILLYNKKLYIGGSFNSYQDQPRNFIVGLNQNGSINHEFNVGNGLINQNPFMSGEVFTIKNDILGNIYVSGRFTEYKNNILNNYFVVDRKGNLIKTLNIGSGFQFRVFSMHVISRRRILCGGQFENYNNIPYTKNFVTIDIDGNISEEPINETIFNNLLSQNLNPVSKDYIEINNNIKNVFDLYIDTSPNDKTFSLGKFLELIELKKDEIYYINNLINQYSYLFDQNEIKNLKERGLNFI